MDNKKKNTAFSDTDPFWDLDKLLPKRGKEIYGSTRFNTETVDFSADITSIKSDAENIRLAAKEIIKKAENLTEKIPPRESSQFPPITNTNKTTNFEKWLEERKRMERNRGLLGKRVLTKYQPNNPLIKNVTISVDEHPARTAERFLSDAESLYPLEAVFTENVPFDSYYPQYSQLNKAQKACYIGFRTMVRCGEYPKVDRAYIYLYIYELINLTGRMTTEERVKALVSLINGYSDCDARLFSDMCNWLCDTCLIYNIELPEGVFGDNISRVIDIASVKEFFIRTDRSMDAGIAFMITSGRYDYRKSKFYPEYRKFFDKHINNAVAHALKTMAEKDSRFSGNDTDICTLTHESYFGALCTAAARRTISLECLCITRSESVRRTVTELVKYAENCLRGHLGIKPRLTVSELNLERKELIKSYFRSVAAEIPMQSRATRPFGKEEPREIPDYEKYYEPKSVGISFKEAAKIEKDSWSLTEKLVTDAELDAPEVLSALPEVHSSPFTEAEKELLSSKEPERSKAPSIVNENEKDKTYSEALRILLNNGDASFCTFAKSSGYLPDALADEINDRFYDIVGDIVIISGETHEIIDDYLDEINEFIG